MSAAIAAGSRPVVLDEAEARRSVYRLVVSWQHPTRRGIHPIGVLSFDGSDYEFSYIQNATDVEDFRPLLGLDDFHTRYRSPRLFPVFAQRVMDPRRPDYSRYVTSLGLDPSTATPWEQISRSGGRRQGDTLQLLPEPRIVDGHISCAFLVHGIRYIAGRERVLGGQATVVSALDLESALVQLRPGDRLTLLDEPGNEQNTEALVTADGVGTPLGYVPNLLVHDVHRLRELTDVRVSVVRVNPADAPSHLRLIARLEADDVEGFRFFQEPYWRLLS